MTREVYILNGEKKEEIGKGRENREEERKKIERKKERK